MSNPSILVVGAGVAGLALAASLTGRADVLVVEHDAALRRGGQTVDLRGPSRTVVDRLGLTAELLRRRVPQRGYAIVDADDRPLVRHPVELFDGHGIVSDTEVLRGDLVDVLAGAAADAEFRFGTSVRALRSDAGGVDVGFSDGTRGRFDVVVGADGVGSVVRRLAFGPDEEFRRPIGVGIAWFSADGPFGGPSGDWYRAHHVPGLRVGIRPGREAGSFRCELAFRCERWDAPRRGREAVLADLEHRFAGVGWHTRALVDAARTTDDLAAQEIASVRVPRWSAGRVVLLGDAAWCPTPLSGTGTAMALVGAHVLADGLRRNPSGAGGFYPADFTAWVARRARLPPGGAAGFVPGSRAGLAFGRTTMRWMGRPPFRAAARRMFTRPDELDLPAGPLTARAR
jgi:2-polyprenyl-6-methoxyphenol hydroxylase-like FAD-dependent oxidoreductase